MGVGTLVVLVTVIVLAHIAGGYMSHRITADMAVVNRSAAVHAAHGAAQVALAELARSGDLDGDGQIGGVGSGDASDLNVGSATATATLVTRTSQDKTSAASEQQRVLEVVGQCGDAFYCGEVAIGDAGQAGDTSQSDERHDNRREWDDTRWGRGGRVGWGESKGRRNGSRR